jgi:hypothetical protein
MVFAAVVMTSLTFAYGLEGNSWKFDKDMQECIKEMTKLVKETGVHNPYPSSGQVMYAKLCESAYNNYDKYLQDMSTEEFDHASTMLKDYMENIE